MSRDLITVESARQSAVDYAERAIDHITAMTDRNRYDPDDRDRYAQIAQAYASTGLLLLALVEAGAVK